MVRGNSSAFLMDLIGFSYLSSFKGKARGLEVEIEWRNVQHTEVDFYFRISIISRNLSQNKLFTSLPFLPLTWL